MDPLKIIQKYYDSESRLYNILVNHSTSVKKKALVVAKKVKHLNPDLEFIKEASMLHDIGIFQVYASQIECFGENPYPCHGYLGRKILEKEGFFKHALVCERHIGVGITKEDIIKQKLPLPKRNMVPVTLEEKIISFADNFFSKDNLLKEKSIDAIKKNLARFGKWKVERFEKELEFFGN